MPLLQSLQLLRESSVVGAEKKGAGTDRNMCTCYMLRAHILVPPDDCGQGWI